jgi:hypothetical protein
MMQAPGTNALAYFRRNVDDGFDKFSNDDGSKRCIVDTVERSCPYYADRGPPNCDQGPML